MIVTLGTGTAVDGQSQTVQYNANSLQKIYVYAVNAGVANIASQFRITVQIGNRTLVNNISGVGLQLISSSQVGGFNANVSTSVESIFGIQLGSHICGQDTIYVTISATATITNWRIGALVNEPVASMPLKLNEYSDSSFADQNTLQAYVYTALADNLITGTASLDTIETRNQSFSQSNQIGTLVLANAADGFVDQQDFNALGKIISSRVPLSTTFNKSGTSLITCVSAMDNSPQDRAVARQQAQAVKSVMSPSERRAL
jgi:hypothetical protein